MAVDEQQELRVKQAAEAAADPGGWPGAMT